MFTFVCVSLTNAVPVTQNSFDLDNDGKISTNELFQQINGILQHNIHNRIKDESLEVGDKLKGDHGHLQIQVKQFEPDNGFPVTFKPSDDTIIDDLEVIPIGGDLDGSFDYIIKRDSTASSTDTQETESSTAENGDSSARINKSENAAQSSTTGTPSTTTIIC